MIRLLPDLSDHSFAQDMHQLEQLGLSQILYRFCNDTTLTRCAMETVSSLLQKPQDILERQEIVKDFLQFPSCCDRLVRLKTEIKELRKEDEVLRKHMWSTNKDSIDSNLQSAFLDLSSCAGLLLRLLRLYKELNEQLENCHFHSTRLQEIKTYFKCVCDESTFFRFGEIIQKLANIYENDATLAMEVFLNEGRQLSAEWIVVDERSISKMFSGAHLRNDIKDLPYTDEVILELSVASVQTVHMRIQQISSALLETLNALNEDACFYQFASRYVEYLKARKIPMVFPTICEESCSTSVSDMVSLDLIGEKRFIQENDMHFSPITIIFGENNTGKTSYLRAWALMQLFAQAGLPIPAQSATIGIVSHLLLEFASGEKTLGRFEEEVKAIRYILDNTQKNTMILLNEVFQSTSYSEIAEPFWHIVSAMVTKGAQVLIVTHNQHFIKYCQNQPNVQMLEALEGFHIKKHRFGGV